MTDEKKDYMDNKGLENAYYKNYIISFIEKFGSATRQDINNFIYPKLSSTLSEKEKNNRVRYLIGLLRKEGKIINSGSDTKPLWIIIK